MKGAFGTPATSGEGSYTHIYEIGNWNLPSFSVEVGLLEVPSFPM